MNRIKPLLILVFVFLLTVNSHAEELPVADFDSVEKWQITSQRGANASLAYDYDKKLASGVLNVTYAFSGKGKDQRNFCLKPESSDVEIQTLDAVRLWLKGNGTKAKIKIRVCDQTGEIFAHRSFAYLSNEEWAPLTVSFRKNPHHWSGNKDGIMDPPVKFHSIMIMGKFDQEPIKVKFGKMSFIGNNDRKNQVPSNKNNNRKSKFGLTIEELGAYRPIKPGSSNGISCILINKSDKEIIANLKITHKLLLVREKIYQQQAAVPSGSDKKIFIKLLFNEPGVNEIEITATDSSGELLVRKQTVVNVWQPTGNDWQDHPNTFFGCMESLDTMRKTRDYDLSMMRDAGVKIVRFVMRWRSVEKSKGQYNWQGYDEIFEACHKNGIIPYPILVRAPKWAIDPNILASAPPNCMDWLPDIPLYVEFVKKAVKRYQKYQPVWQIWNEPYAQHYFWGGSADDYADLLKAAYIAIKNIDPKIPVNTGALTSDDYARTVLKRLQFKYFDNYPFHCHGGVKTLYNSIKDLKKVFGDRYEKFKHVIWCDETGFAVDPEIVGSELKKAAAVIKKLTVCRYEGFSNHTWFIFRHFPKCSINPRDNYPAVDFEGRTRPVVLAHNTASRLLRKSKCSKDYSFGGYGEAYVFNRDNEKILVVWGTESDCGQVVCFQVTKSAKVSRYTLLGTNVPVKPVNGLIRIPINEYPCFFVIKDGDLKHIESKWMLNIPPRVLTSGNKTVSCQIKINNIYSEKTAGILKIVPSKKYRCSPNEAKFEIIPGGSKKICLQITPSTNSDKIYIPFYIDLDNPAQKIKGQIKVISCQELSAVKNPITIDGKLDEWSKKPFVDLNSNAYVQDLKVGEADPDLHWQGVDDLRGQLFVGWDKENLYMAVKVNDNIHFQDRNDGFIFTGDSLQVAIATGPEKLKADVQFGLSLKDGKPNKIHYWQGNLGDAPKYAVRRSGKETLYEIAIPWSSLDFKPGSGNMILISALINDNDGRGRKIIMEWGRGIHGNRAIDLFRPLILGEN